MTDPGVPSREERYPSDLSDEELVQLVVSRSGVPEWFAWQIVLVERGRIPDETDDAVTIF